MERSAPMNPRIVAIVSAALLCLLSEAAWAERRVVLLTNDRCPVSTLSNLEVRKAYLGVSVSVGEQRLRPLRLVADKELNQIFFQTIVAMSEKSYNRRALSLAVKFGTPRPEEYSSLDEALNDLQRSICSVIFLWAQDADLQDTKEIRVLWQGD